MSQWPCVRCGVTTRAVERVCARCHFTHLERASVLTYLRWLMFRYVQHSPQYDALERAYRTIEKGDHKHV